MKFIGIFLIMLPLSIFGQIGTFSVKTDLVQFKDEDARWKTPERQTFVFTFDVNTNTFQVDGEISKVLKFSDDGITTVIETEDEIWYLTKGRIIKKSFTSSLQDGIFTIEPKA